MTSCIFLAISLVLATALGKKFCVTSPELYYANVAGRIDGGYDDISLIDQTPCSQKTNLDRTYRQIDGKCNHPMDYGSALQPNKRYLQPHYMDDKGINTPRIYSVVGGTYLPSPRLLSWKLFPDVKVVTNTSLWTMQFGQFVNHDITSVQCQQ
ncbi:chorion peroxidase-like, partial [Physella acuta]|uniref:chorion peroxidase-like n=1 Tax=Physella acuta TaxID=109671 RepID=UPI0027DE1C40